MISAYDFARELVDEIMARDLIKANVDYDGDAYADLDDAVIPLIERRILEAMKAGGITS